MDSHMKLNEKELIDRIYTEINKSKGELEQRIIQFHVDCGNIISRIKDRVRELERVRAKERESRELCQSFRYV